MTLDLTPIKARLEAATPGEWAREIDPYDDLKFFRIVTQDNVYMIGRGLGTDDSDLIAHAPADLRMLVAEVERLRAELAAYQHEGDGSSNETSRHCATKRQNTNACDRVKNERGMKRKLNEAKGRKNASKGDRK